MRNASRALKDTQIDGEQRNSVREFCSKIPSFELSDLRTERHEKQHQSGENGKRPSQLEKNLFVRGGVCMCNVHAIANEF